MFKKIKKKYNELFPKRFADYWSKKNSNFDDELKFITNVFIKSKSYKFVSKFWHMLNIWNYESLNNFGIEKYGSTIAKNYYTFTNIKEEYIDDAILKINHSENQSIEFELLKKHNNFTFTESINYNFLCLILFLNLKKTDSFKFINKLNDKTYLGYDDPFIKIENFNVTIDKAASLLDYDKLKKAFNLNNFNNILEIGAGSGRTSEVILSINNIKNYIICDIPPATYISYQRLKKAFPEKKISLLIDVEEKNKLIDQINSNDISFIYPHQLELINKSYIDLVIAIDCFHEMDKKTINFYFNNINNISKNLYFSIWKKTKNFHSKTFFKKTERLDFDKGDYSIPNNWDNNFKENLIFPSNQICLGYKINNND